MRGINLRPRDLNLAYPNADQRKLIVTRWVKEYGANLFRVDFEPYPTWNYAYGDLGPPPEPANIEDPYTVNIGRKI